MKESRVMTEGERELIPVPGRLASTMLLRSDASPIKNPLWTEERMPGPKLAAVFGRWKRWGLRGVTGWEEGGVTEETANSWTESSLGSRKRSERCSCSEDTMGVRMGRGTSD
jgi:hypothetical protein